MRRYWMVACVGWGLCSPVGAQNVNVTPNPASMPGTTVGQMMPASKAVLKPVGNPLPKAAPQAGTPITGLATNKPNTITPGGVQPQGVPIDLKNVIAPYPNMPKERTYWEQLESRWFDLFKSDAPAERTNWTPGLARRNRERTAERNKIRD